MVNRNDRILRAAHEVFLRYGVKRTTMNDIAREAGVARQTLYNAFSNKDEILRALVRDFHRDAIKAAGEHCAKLESVADKLDAVLQHMVLKPYDLINTSPHAREIIEGINVLAREEISASREGYVALLETVLSQDPGYADAARPTPKDVAELVFCAAKGARDYTDSRAELKRVLSTLRTVVCSPVTVPP